MAYIAGWRAEDLPDVGGIGNFAGPDSVKRYGPAGGFLVPAGATVANVIVQTGANQAGKNLRAYIYSDSDGALLAQTGVYVTVGGVEAIPLQVSWVPESDAYVHIALHSDTYVQTVQETSLFRYFPFQNQSFAVGPPDPFSQSGTANDQRSVIWLDGSAAVSGPTITEADDIADESQPATFTLSGNENAPTGITINGEAGSNITFVSEDTGAGTETYSYEPPLIADDDTADLVVSVDGTTAGATIAYANSYDRDQLTHPATEAEYSENSLSYPNAYATTQAYEWKVIADANASVVTINWNALEADDGFHKDVASYATPVANGSTTVTLGVFVPETGQAYQFDRTITVSDGSVVVEGEGLFRSLFSALEKPLFKPLFR